MVIDLGEAQILVGHVPQFADSAIDIATALLHFFQQGAQALVSHGRIPGGV